MRRVSVLISALLLGFLAVPSSASPTLVDTTGTAYSMDRAVVPILFPVLGPTSYSDNYLACRSGCARKHMGQDLMGPKMSPLVAACDGTVASLKRESSVGEGNYLVLACDHGKAAGWSAVYLHINNDTPGTDDGRGTASYAFPKGIAVGVRVLAGQLVAWRGDSGNAESTGPHLHFELRKGYSWGGVVYNAFPSLQAARHIAAPTASGPHPDGTLIRTPQKDLYVISNLQKRLVTPGVLSANRLSGANAIDVTAAESARYLTLAPLWPRDGALLKDQDGAIWRVLGSHRYLATPNADEPVFPVPASDLARLQVMDAPVLPFTSGMVIRTSSGTFEIGQDGQLHSVYPTLMASYGWTQQDVVPVAADLELPWSVGDPLGFRDGTLALIPGKGVAVLSGGVVRRVWDTRELNAYGYAGKPRLSVAASSVAGLPEGEVAGGPVDQWRSR
ncbi:MAG: N-acetylmuramoyl-L-alanine amidase [Frankiales bacterium]|nr:N-acetylmuramoyl-L-alanine amidase [Frankiales bacterium]